MLRVQIVCVSVAYTPELYWIELELLHSAKQSEIQQLRHTHLAPWQVQAAAAAAAVVVVVGQEPTEEAEEDEDEGEGEDAGEDEEEEEEEGEAAATWSVHSPS